MLMVLSPAKALEFEHPLEPGLAALSTTTPLLLDEAIRLIGVLKRLSSADIAQLMDLSDKLAELNFTRFQDWQADHRESASGALRAALWAFNGDVYTGLAASNFTPEDALWAQQHLRILSGLYGVLRPLDRMRPYRLEMGTSLATTRGKNLVAFWGAHIRDQLIEALNADTDDAVLVNLASQEYFASVQAADFPYPIVDCVFEDWTEKKGYHVIGLHAKKARGLMARFIIQNRVTRVADLQHFQAAGYHFVPPKPAPKSYPKRLLFRRKTLKP